jgi:peptidyl-prolyl cis-trans isomerase SurA
MSRPARKLAYLTLVLLAALAVRPAAGQDTLRIVALVNDEAITGIDLAARTQIVVASSRLENTPEVRQRLQPQVLRTLIDERLRMQAAERQGIVVSQSRVDDQMTQMARSNNLTLEQFRAVLSQNSIDPAWLEEQIRTEIAWSMLIGQKFRPSVVITDEDIDIAERRMREGRGAQYQLAEIFLAVDDPNETQAVREAAMRLLDQLRQGADFATMARQFSQATTAAEGGLLGWLAAADMAPEIAAAVESMRPGSITGPVLGDGGFHILLLLNRRAAQEQADMTRQQIGERLLRERLEVLARGYLRDLRRSAYVDIRQ